MLVAIVLVLIALGVAVALLRRISRRREPAPIVSAFATGWTEGVADKFARLSEAQRCDLLFALGVLDDEPSLQLLQRALDDPSESVALAAARALVRRGGGDVLERYFAEHPGARARSLRLLVEILN